MSLEKSLRDYLLADPTIAGMVGTRIFPQVIPQGSDLPCLVYAKESRQVQQLFCGEDGLRRTMIGIDCYAVVYDDSVGLANAVSAAMRDFSGVMGATRVPRIFLENELDLSDIEPGLYRQSQTWAVWHREL